MSATHREVAIGFQAMRCGHIDGKARAGVYTLGEESFHSSEAVENMRSDYRSDAERRAATFGYESGYQRGATGEELPSYAVTAPLPDAGIMNDATEALGLALAALQRLQGEPSSVARLKTSLTALEALATILNDYKPRGSVWAPDVSAAMDYANEINFQPDIRSL